MSLDVFIDMHVATAGLVQGGGRFQETYLGSFDQGIDHRSLFHFCVPPSLIADPHGLETHQKTSKTGFNSLVIQNIAAYVCVIHTAPYYNLTHTHTERDTHTSLENTPWHKQLGMHTDAVSYALSM